MIDHGVLIRLLILHLLFQVANLTPQTLIIFLKFQLVGLEFNILGNHFFDALLGPLVERFVEEMDSHLQIEVLL